MEGMEQVYVHVHRSNKSAQELYQKMGLEVMWMHLFLLYFWFQFLAFYFYSRKD
jgi:ribosomal protein S18 acetylase RimI-like enzyme